MYEDFPSAVLLPSSCLFSKDVVENIDVLFLVKAEVKKIWNMELPLGGGGGRGDGVVVAMQVSNIWKYLESFCVLIYLWRPTQKIILLIRILPTTSQIGLFLVNV